MANILRQVEDLQPRVTVKTDTLVALSRRSWPDYKQELELSGAKVTPRPRRDKQGRIWWRPIHINGATAATYSVIEKWKPVRNNAVNAYGQIANWPGLKLNRHDIALDLKFADRGDMLQAVEQIASAVQLKRISKKARRHWVETTLYIHDTRGGEKPARTLVMYEKPGWVLRIELRFQNSDAVKRNGLDDLTPDALARVNPRELFERHVGLRVIDPDLVAKHTRLALERHDARQHENEEFAQRWRAMLPHRVAGMYRRYAISRPTHRLPTVTNTEWLALVPTQLQLP